MKTLKNLKEHAQMIMASGGPKSKDEIAVIEIFNRLMGTGKSSRAGKRTKKNHNNNW